jgi:hypothetical protein
MKADEFAASLRLIAAFYDEHPDMPVPYLGLDDELSIYIVNSQNPTATLAAVAKQFGRAQKTMGETFFNVGRRFGAITLRAMAYREAVCERVVTGTRTVERPITETVGTEEVTEEVVEWRCPESLLSALAVDDLFGEDNSFDGDGPMEDETDRARGAELVEAGLLRPDEV